MRLYLSAKTNAPDLMIDFIEVKLKSGNEVSLNWDESDISRREDGFDARYKGVYFGEEYANGRIDELQDMEISHIQLYSDLNHDVRFEIEEMEFEDEDKSLVFATPDLSKCGGLDRPEEPEMNTKISYLYRDADNYKVYNECIVPGVLTQEQEEAILDSRHDGEWFIPSLVGLPGKDFTSLGYDYDEEVDHPWFELDDDGFQKTTASPTVSVTAQELAGAFLACRDKWETISREAVLQAMAASQQTAPVHVFEMDQTTINTYFDTIKYWSNAVGELHHHGQYDITIDELPSELHHAYNDLFTDQYSSLCYLVETDAGYGIALVNEYDEEVTAKLAGVSMDELFALVEKDAHVIAAHPDFRQAQIYVGQSMGFCECHELVVVFPADISEEEFAKAAATLGELSYRSVREHQPATLSDKLQDAADRAGEGQSDLQLKNKKTEPEL